MKNFLLGFVLLLLISCGSGTIKTTNPASVDNPPADLTTNSTSGSGTSNSAAKSSKTKLTSKPFTDTTRIGGIMNFLASDDLKGRDSGSEGLEKAAEFIEGIFEQNNVMPYFETYKDTLSNFTKTTFNVVGLLEGNDPELKKEFIVIGAHYDHIGIIRPVNGDAIANGANDNASGTTTVLELARYFGNKKSNKRSLVFALFSAEEKGLLGSKHLAKKLKEEDLNLYTMINFEMTGVPMRGKSFFIFITGFDKSNMAEIRNGYAGEKLIGFLPKSKEFDLFKRSDNYPFYEQFGVPSHTFCTFDFSNFVHYHGVGDEVSALDLDHMAKVVNKMIPVVEGITNAPTQEIK
ncbi:MAG: M28 family peptidase [Bacteroidota bacterium]